MKLTFKATLLVNNEENHNEDSDNSDECGMKYTKLKSTIE